MTQDNVVVRLLVDRDNSSRITGKVLEAKTGIELHVVRRRNKKPDDIFNELDKYCDNEGLKFRQYSCPPTR